MSATRRYVAEALGTFALVAIGPGAAMVAELTGTEGALLPEVERTAVSEAAEPDAARSPGC